MDLLIRCESRRLIHEHFETTFWVPFLKLSIRDIENIVEEFWDFISGDSELYTKIIKPLGHRAKERNQEFVEEYSAIINRFTQEFNSRFCTNGNIDWESLVKFNSAVEKPK